MTEEYLLSNNKLNVMLVCNMLFFESEKEIIYALTKEGINLYIKPHPKDNAEIYKALKSSSFIILGANEFPKVDIVISYQSTLGVKYEQAGVKVLWYDAIGTKSCIEYVKGLC